MALSRSKSLRFLFVAIVIGIALLLIRQYSRKAEIPIGSGSSQVVLAALGDSGTGGEAQLKVADSLRRICEEQNCDAVILLGDVIYDKGVESVDDLQFKTKFEIPYKAIDAPFYIALGNHDHFGCVDCYIQYDSNSPKWEFPNYYYRHSFGSLVDIFVLDTDNFSKDQAAWLEQETKKSTAAWKIAVGHHPIYTNSKQYSKAYPEKKALLSSSVCYNFDLYLSGHTHGLEDLGEICGVRHIVSGGGGGDLYEIIPNQSPFSAESYGLLLLKAQTDSITLFFYNERGEILYRVKPP